MRKISYTLRLYQHKPNPNSAFFLDKAFEITFYYYAIKINILHAIKTFINSNISTHFYFEALFSKWCENLNLGVLAIFFSIVY